MIDWGNVAQIASAAVSALALLIALSGNVRKAFIARVSKVEEKIECLESDVAALKGEMKHLPDRTVVHRLELTMADIRGDLKEVKAQMKSVSSTGERLQNYLEAQRT